MGCCASEDEGLEAEGANGYLRRGMRVMTQWCKEEGGDDKFYNGYVRRIVSFGPRRCEVDIKYDDGDTWQGDPVWVYRHNPEPDSDRAVRLRHKLKMLLLDTSERPSTDDYYREMVTFDKKICVRLKHIPENTDFSGRYEMFDGCGDMDDAGKLMQQLEESIACRGFDPITKRRCSGYFDSSKAVADDAQLQDLCNTVARSRLHWALGQNTIPALRYALLNAKQLNAQSADNIQDCLAALARLCNLPNCWDLPALLQPEFGYRLLSKSQIHSESAKFVALQQLLDDTHVKRYTQDRSKLQDGRIPQRLVLARVDMVQNVPNWMEYVEKRNAIAAQLGSGGCSDFLVDNPIKTLVNSACDSLPELTASVNEAWLWHGTTPAAAQAITTGDFDLKFVGTRAGCLYGAGVYLAEASTKSDEYAGEDSNGVRPLLLCRATLGKINETDAVQPDIDELVRSVHTKEYHSILGDREKSRGTYREFIVYSEDQVYPAFICWYRRETKTTATG